LKKMATLVGRPNLKGVLNSIEGKQISTRIKDKSKTILGEGVEEVEDLSKSMAVGGDSAHIRTGNSPPRKTTFVSFGHSNVLQTSFTGKKRFIVITSGRKKQSWAKRGANT